MAENLMKRKQLIENVGHHVIYCTDVIEIGFLKKICLLFLTDRTFDLFNKSGTKKIIACSWRKLTRVLKNDKENFLQLEFGKNIHKITCNISILDTIYKAIVYILKKILLPSELISITLPDHVTNESSTTLGIISRLKETAKQMSIRITKETLFNFKKKLIFSSNSMSLSDFPQISSITAPLFLDVLPLLDLDAFKMTSIQDVDAYSLLISFGYQLFSLRKLEIAAPLTPSFEHFIQNLTQNRNSNLKCLSFSESVMDQRCLQILYNYVLLTRLHAIEFHNVIKGPELPFFYNSFLTPKFFDSIRVINFDHSRGLDLDNMFTNMNNVIILSLVDCGFDIPQIFSSLSVVFFPSFREINVSGNTCNSPINLEFPSSLQKIVADNVIWRDGECLQSLIFSICNQFNQTGFSLSLDNVKGISHEGLQSFFSILEQLSFDGFVFHEFSWNNNYINITFFNCLLKFTIHQLSLSGIFDQSNPNDIGIFSSYLGLIEPNKLTSLNIAGDDTHVIGTQLSTILDSIKSPLQFLDISESQAGDSGASALLSFLAKGMTKILVCDGLGINDPSPILQAAKAKGIHVSFPVNDIKVQTLDEPQIDSLLNDYGLYSQTPVYFDNNIGYFDAPSKFFIYSTLPKVPIYLDSLQQKSYNSKGRKNSVGPLY